MANYEKQRKQVVAFLCEFAWMVRQYSKQRNRDGVCNHLFPLFFIICHPYFPLHLEQMIFTLVPPYFFIQGKPHKKQSQKQGIKIRNSHYTHNITLRGRYHARAVRKVWHAIKWRRVVLFSAECSDLLRYLRMREFRSLGADALLCTRQIRLVQKSVTLSFPGERQVCYCR